MPVLNELKKDVLNNTKSKTIYEENHQIYQLCQKLRQIRKEKNLSYKIKSHRLISTTDIILLYHIHHICQEIFF